MDTDKFTKILEKNQFGPYVGIPCSTFKYLLNYIIEKKIEYYPCTSEGEAMGLAAGIALTQKNIPIVYMQSDGFANALNPLTSLQMPYSIPSLLLISHRGDPQSQDAEQHKVMGASLKPILDILDVPFEEIDPYDFKKQVSRIKKSMIDNSECFALIIPQGTFDKYAVDRPSERKKLYLRSEYLEKLNEYIVPTDIVVGSTGLIGREMSSIIKSGAKFYMSGSMGCASSIGLGLALKNPDKRVFVLDGDGALLMKMGALTTVAVNKPKNFIHICFSNDCYESTGGQPLNPIDLDDIASLCGYKECLTITKLKNMRTFTNLEGPVFLNILIRPGQNNPAPRPNETLKELAEKFRKLL